MRALSESNLQELLDYAIVIRRQLHEYPEVGFELYKTCELVENELKKLGIECVKDFGKCSLVAEIGQGEKTLALRADMDALPVEEKTDLPYKSKIPGKMHACGHDSHTAILIAVAKYLKENENKLPYKIRLVFQPSEECAESGAKMMVDNGVMDNVDKIICTHCENSVQSGKIATLVGDYMAACVPANVRFIGKSAHATLPEFGIDAIAMANKAYIELKKMVAEEAGDNRYIWSVGRISGGTAHNIISENCEMDISFRFYNMEFAKRVEKRTFEICKSIADEFGGKVVIDWNMSTGPVHNDAKMVEEFLEIAKQNEIIVEEDSQSMGSEDFGWYLTKAPGMAFMYGTGNSELGCTAVAHRSDFMIDEAGMKTAIKTFLSYIFNAKEI